MTVAIVALLLSFQAPGEPAELRTLDRLVHVYKSYRLPIPPNDAPLVRIDNLTSSPEINCGYRLRNDAVSGTTTVLLGTTEATFPSKDVETMRLDSAAINAIELMAWSLNFREDAGIAMAVVEHDRGHDSVALGLLRRIRSQPFESPARGPWTGVTAVEDRVGDLAFQHLQNALAQPDSDRVEILERLERVLRRDTGVATGRNRELLKNLRETVLHRYTGANPDENLVDALCDSQVSDMYYRANLKGPDPYRPLYKILDRGFEAVPTLMAHLSDRRLSRVVDSGMDMGLPHLETVGDICGRILFAYRVEDQVNVSDTSFESDNRARLAKWWMAASKTSETDHLRRWLVHPVDGEPQQELVYLAYRRHLKVLEMVQAVLRKTKRLDVLERIHTAVQRFRADGCALRG